MGKQNDENIFDDNENDFSPKENEDKAKKDEEETKRIELPYTVDLEFPFTVAGKEYASVTFKRGLIVEDVKHLPLDFKAQKLGHFTRPIAGMTELPTAIIDAMNMSDFNKCLEVVQSFL